MMVSARISEAATEVNPVRLLATATDGGRHAMTEINSSTKTCACGCGGGVTPGKCFVKWHHLGVGEDNPRWKGGLTHDQQGHVLVMMPNHPNAKPSGYVKRSRLVAEKKLGRRLLAGEVVHHINKIPNDDRPDNLMVIGAAEHQALHMREKGRLHLKGEMCKHSKLTRVQVDEILALAFAGKITRKPGHGKHLPSTTLNLTRLGRLYGVSAGTISHVLDGRTWR